MANYIIKFIGGGTLKITKEDFNNLMGKSGLIGIKSCGQVVNTSSISRILSEEDYEKEKEKENEKGSNLGVLHDGTPVIRYFGVWYSDGEFDENGRPYQRIDQTYYKEVARDCVYTPNQYERIKHLPKEKRLEIMLGGSKEENIRIGSGFKKLGDIKKL